MCQQRNCVSPKQANRAASYIDGLQRRRTAAKLLSEDEARSIAANIAKIKRPQQRVRTR
jgi:hypothetical protein